MRIYIALILLVTMCLSKQCVIGAETTIRKRDYDLIESSIVDKTYPHKSVKDVQSYGHRINIELPAKPNPLGSFRLHGVTYVIINAEQYRIYNTELDTTVKRIKHTWATMKTIPTDWISSQAYAASCEITSPSRTHSKCIIL